MAIIQKSEYPPSMTKAEDAMRRARIMRIVAETPPRLRLRREQ